MTISRKGLANGETLELIKLSYALNKEKFVKEFDKVKVKIESVADLDLLSNIVKAKLDISGRMKDKVTGNVIMFDTMKIIDGLGKYTKEEKDAVLNNSALFID